MMNLFVIVQSERAPAFSKLADFHGISEKGHVSEILGHRSGKFQLGSLQTGQIMGMLI